MGNFSPLLSGLTTSSSSTFCVSFAVGRVMFISPIDEVESRGSSSSESGFNDWSWFKRYKFMYVIQTLDSSSSMAILLALFPDLFAYPMWKSVISGTWNKEGSSESHICFATRLRTSLAPRSWNPPSFNSLSSRRTIGERCNKLSLSLGLHRICGSRPNSSISIDPSRWTISAKEAMIATNECSGRWRQRRQRKRAPKKATKKGAKVWRNRN